MKAKMYTKTHCSYCQQAKLLMDMRGIEYSEVNIETDSSARDTLLTECQSIGVVPRTVPQIWLDDEYVGGYQELVAHLAGL